MSTRSSPLRIDTRLVHAGEPEPRIGGAVAMPIFQSATFEPLPGTGYHELRYARLSTTPNHEALHAKLASLEGAEAALVTASGMAAITTTLLTVLVPGGHLLVDERLYGGTYDFITRDLGDLGLDFDFIDAKQPRSWEAKLRPDSRALYVESITNPLIEIVDLEGVARFAREHGLVSIIDNTFASPVNFRPLEHGFDLVVHSATKYLNGHSDVIAGAVVGAEQWLTRIKHRLDHLGGALDPHAAFLLHRGLKTLALRVERQNANALALARFLDDHSSVARVHYPGLESHPDHERARALFEGFGGVLSFELGAQAVAPDTLFERLELPVAAPSLGGCETLVTRPSTTSHAGLSAAERERLGIAEGLVRVAIGIEAAEDLVADFSRALD